MRSIVERTVGLWGEESADSLNDGFPEEPGRTHFEDCTALDRQTEEASYGSDSKEREIAR